MLATSGGTWFVLVPMVGYTQLEYVAGGIVVACGLLTILAGAARMAVRRPWLASVLLALMCTTPFALRGLPTKLPISVLSEAMCKAWLRREKVLGVDSQHSSDSQQPVRISGFISAPESAEIAQRVLAHPEKFLHIRQWGTPFFTSGVYHGYMSTSTTVVHSHEQRHHGSPVTDRLTYAEGIAATEPWLSHKFGALHEKLRSELEKQLSSDVMWMPSMGRPGFHVIYSHVAFSFPVFHLHTDIGQLLKLKTKTWPHVGLASWPAGKLCELNRQVAFTLPVQLPSAGCGLDFVSTDGCTGKGQTCTSCARLDSVLYELGTLYVHVGALIHQIRPWKYRSADAQRPRITLQGFGVRCNRTWYLYW